MWEHPINQQSSWFGCLFATIFMAVVLAAILLIFCLYFTYQSCVRPCFTRTRSQKKTSKRRRRIVLIMPEGQRTPSEDYVIDLDGDRPSTERLGGGSHRCSTFRTSASPTTSGIPTLDGMAKDCDFDFDHPPPPASWLFKGDEDKDTASSIVTATVCRKLKSATPTHSAMMKIVSPCSEADSLSDSNYRSFTASREDAAVVPSEAPTCPPIPAEITAEDASNSSIILSEEEELEQFPERETVTDETLPSSSKPIIVAEHRKIKVGLEKVQMEIESEMGNGTVNRKATPDLPKNVKKVGSPVAPDPPKLQDTPEAITPQDSQYQLKIGDEQEEESRQ